MVGGKRNGFTQTGPKVDYEAAPTHKDSSCLTEDRCERCSECGQRSKAATDSKEKADASIPRCLNGITRSRQQDGNQAKVVASTPPSPATRTRKLVTSSEHQDLSKETSEGLGSLADI